MSAQADAAGGKQSRRMSVIEAIANVAVGYALALLTQMLVFPIFGLQASLSDNLAVIVSALRLRTASNSLRSTYERVREIVVKTSPIVGQVARRLSMVLRIL